MPDTVKKRGGARAGAGRPKGKLLKKTILEAQARNILIEEILKEWRPIINIMISVAKGKAKYMTKGKDKKVYVFTKPPNVGMLNELTSFVVGKPKQSFEGTLDMPQLQELSDSVKAILNKHESK